MADAGVAEAAADEDAAGRRLGAYIRQLRHAREMTLVRLADATGLSHPFLSQLERGLAQPSLSTLRRIAVALETSPIELIAAADPPPPDRASVEVHRRDEASIDRAYASGSARMLAHGDRPLHPLEMESHNAEPGECFVHAEDEFVYVVDGAVQMELAGDRLALGPGDSAYFAGGVTHRWWSADGGRYRVVVVKQGLSGRRGGTP